MATGSEPLDMPAIRRPDTRTTTFSRRVTIVAACGSFFVFAVSAVILPAALVRAAEDFDVSAGTLTLVASTQFAAFFLATIVGGLLSDRYGKPPVLQVGCGLIVLGSVLWACAGNLFAAHVAAAFLGMGGGILEGMGSALLADLYPDRRKFILNLSQVAYCAGAVAGPVVMSFLLPLRLSWRIFFAAEAALGVVLLGLYRLAPPSRPSGAPGCDLMHALQFLRERSVFLPAIGLFGYVLAESGVVIYVNLYLQKQHGAPEHWAILGLSLVWAAMLVGRLLCAALPERLPTGRLITALTILSAAVLAVQFLAQGWVVSLALFGVTGFLFSGIWPLTVALCANVHPDRTGSAVGLVIAIGSLGVVVAPMVVDTLLQTGYGRYIFPVLGLALLGTVVTRMVE